MTILHGDDKFFNNIFIQQDMRPYLKDVMDFTKTHFNDWDDHNLETGTNIFSKYPTYEEWKEQFNCYCGMGSVTTDRYYDKLPVWTKGNLYFNGAVPSVKEESPFVDNKNKIFIKYEEKDGKPGISTNLYDFIPEANLGILNTDSLEPAFESEQKYENPDGSAITFDTDILGQKRSGKTIAGPFANKADAQKGLF